MAKKEFPLSVVVRAIDRVTAPMRAIQAKVGDFSKIVSAKFRAASDQLGLPALRAAAGRVGSSLGNLGRKVGGLATKFTAVTSAATAAGLAMLKSFASRGDSIAKTADRLGIGIERFQELRFAGEQAGVSNEEFDKGLHQLNQRLGKGTAGKVLDALGVSLRDAQGRIKNTGALLPEFADKFRLIEDPATRSAIAAELFGRQAGDKFVTLLKDGSGAIAEQSARARELGLVMDEASARGGERFGDAFNEASKALRGLGDAISSAVLPHATELINRFTAFATEVRPQIQEFAKNFAAELPERLRTLRDEFRSFMEKIDPLIAVLRALVDRFGAANIAIVAVTVAFVPLTASVITATASLATLSATIVATSLKMLRFLIPSMKSVRVAMLVTSFVTTGTLIPALASAGAAFKAFGMAIITTPGIGWILLAIGLIVAGAILIYKHWDEISMWLGDNVFEPFGRALDAVVSWVEETWDKIRDFFREGIDGIGKWFAGFGKKLSELVPEWARRMFGGSGQASLEVRGQAAGVGAASIGSDAASVQNGRVSVDVNFNQMPPGTRVDTQTSGQPQFELNQGFAFGVP